MDKKADRVSEQKANEAAALLRGKKANAQVHNQREMNCLAKHVPTCLPHH